MEKTTTNEIEAIENLEQELGSNTTTNDTKKEENEDNTVNNNAVLFTQAQQDIIKEIAKIDVELEQLNSNTINEDEFYDSLDSILTDEEKYLQEENPKEYLKLIDSKKKEFIQNKSNDSKKNELEEKRKELELRNAIEIGVLEVTKLYKDYNHIEMQTFYNKKLSKEEQEEILNTSKTTFEVFKKTHEKYLEKNGAKVIYIESDDILADFRNFDTEIKKKNITEINVISPSDDWLQRRLKKAAENIKLNILDLSNMIKITF